MPPASDPGSGHRSHYGHQWTLFNAARELVAGSRRLHSLQIYEPAATTATALAVSVMTAALADLEAYTVFAAGPNAC